MLSTTTALLMLINSIRPNKLINDTALQTMAQERCINMQTFSHDDFYSIYSKKINEKYKYAGEVLALKYSQNKDVLNGWLQSPTHNEIIKSKKYTRLGCASCIKPINVPLYVCLFAGN